MYLSKFSDFNSLICWKWISKFALKIKGHTSKTILQKKREYTDYKLLLSFNLIKICSKFLFLFIDTYNV